MSLHPLGCRAPTDLEHLAKYPLSAAYALDEIPTMPVVIGVSWYTAFDRPVQRGSSWWLPEPGNWGAIRGRHAVCLKPASMTDYTAWWSFYNQGAEGACVGFAWSRAMSLKNRTRYDARWLYHRAQEVDEWPGTAYSGTSVRAGGNVLLSEGHKTPAWTAPRPGAGISTFRWATSMAEVLACLDSPTQEAGGYCVLLNSWGKNGYPHLTRVPHATLERLLFVEGGESVVITDR